MIEVHLRKPTWPDIEHVYLSECVQLNLKCARDQVRLSFLECNLYLKSRAFKQNRCIVVQIQAQSRVLFIEFFSSGYGFKLH